MLSKKYKEITLEGLTVAYYIITSADGFGISVKIFETGESFTAKGISENVLDAVRIATRWLPGLLLQLRRHMFFTTCFAILNGKMSNLRRHLLTLYGILCISEKQHLLFRRVHILRCPFCGYSESRVIVLRPAEEGATIRRRRECMSCQKRFTTYEIMERLPLVVIKKDGSRQTFDKIKMLNGMLRACEKRPVPTASLQSAADEIEQELQNSLEREVTSTEIGEQVMRRLKNLDEVAYVRFASVYRQFKDINTFMEELTKLLNDK